MGCGPVLFLSESAVPSPYQIPQVYLREFHKIVTRFYWSKTFFKNFPV